MSVIYTLPSKKKKKKKKIKWGSYCFFPIILGVDLKMVSLNHFSDSVGDDRVIGGMLYEQRKELGEREEQKGLLEECFPN